MVNIYYYTAILIDVNIIEINNFITGLTGYAKSLVRVTINNFVANVIPHIAHNIIQL